MSSEAEDTTAEGTSAPPRRDVDALPRGTALGRYVVLSCLGSGGMGVVYVCYDPTLDRKVALKLLFAADDPSKSARARERLVKEARSLARLTHPNVVAVHDVDEVESRIYLAMEFVAGQTLGAWVRAAERGWPEVLDVFLQAARGLAAAHDVGLVHRDFKPENAMIGADGRVRVMDFGLARAEADTSDVDTSQGGASQPRGKRGLTATGAVLGTPAYMAPEQHLGLRSDAKADQFAWCVALHEAIFGVRPFRGDTLADLAVAVIEGRISPVTDDRGVPTWLRRIVERGLSRDPNDRFATMHDLLRAVAAGRARQVRARWLLAFAGGGVVVASIFAGRAIDHRRSLAACADEGDAIAEVWNDEARERLRASVLATGVSYGLETFDRATPWLDEAAASWRSTRDDVCRRHDVDHVLSSDLHERALACLDEHRLELSVVLESMEDASPASVHGLVMAAAALDPVDRCGDEAELAREDLPAPERRAEVAEIRRDLVRVDALSRAGRFADAEQIVVGLRERALATGWSAIIVQAELERGSLAQSRGEYEKAEEALREAFERAWSSGRDEEATEAAHLLAYLYATDLRRDDDALRYGRLAELTRERLGERGRTYGASVHASMGIVYSMRGDDEAALRETASALAAVEETLGPNHPEVASILTNVGGMLQKSGKHVEAGAALERALEIRETVLGPRHPDVAATLNNLGAVHIGAGDLERAEATWLEALEIWEESLGPEHAQVALLLRNLSILHHRKGDLEEALRSAERALAIREKSLGHDNRLTGESAQGVAWLQSDLGAHELGRGHASAAVEILGRARERLCERESDVACAIVRSRLGRAMWSARGDRETAHALVQGALPILAGAGEEDDTSDELAATQAWLREHPAP